MPEFQITTQTSLIAFVGIFMFLGGTFFLLFGLGVIRSGEGKDISFKIESGKKTTIIGISGMLIGGTVILWSSFAEASPPPSQTPSTSASPTSTNQPVEIISSPTLEQIAATETTNEPISISGTWVGLIASTNGGVRYQIEVYIKTLCEFGQTCGTYEIPGLSCEGNIIYNGIDEQDFLFAGNKTSGANSCASSSTIRFSLEDINNLNINYSANSSQYIGTLTRK